ncbi:hypothetical protein BGW42_005258 [Actinomortierella wolfii]|nr:hypothetical protein BGW42_005258 [Actinomortierella wolfii]
MASSKNLFYCWALIGLVALLATSVSAQFDSPTAAPTATPSAPPAVTTTYAPPPMITNRPGTNYTGPPPGQFDTLRSIIESYATGRASNPGSSPTPKPGGADSGADKPIVMGSLAILATVALTAAGFMF